MLKLHPNDARAFNAVLRRFAARDHQFAGAEYKYYYLGLLDTVDQPRKLLRLVLDVLKAQAKGDGVQVQTGLQAGRSHNILNVDLGL